MNAFKRIEGKYVVEALTGCWLWCSRLDKDGYAAQMRVGSRTNGTRRNVRPHRWVFEQHQGRSIPEGLVIDHLCRNRACVNPAHMEVVTPLVNHQRGLRAQRTICSKGHTISGANVVYRRGGIRCRVCSNAYQREYQKKTGYKASKAYKARKRSEKSE